MKTKDILNKQRISSTKERLEHAMAIRGIKQTELCKLAGIPKSSMSQYMSGEYEPKQDRLDLMADVLFVSSDWLRGYDVPMGRPQHHYGYEENPRELELCDYFETLEITDQDKVLSYVKAISEGKATNSPGTAELTEGEKLLIDLFRRVPEGQQELVLGMIRGALGIQ